MKAEEQEVLTKIKSVLQKHAPEATAILYGSRARGDARPDSDWDLLVLIDKNKEEATDFARIAYPLYSLGLDINENISVNLYTLNDWEKRSFTFFYKNVQKEGVYL